MVNFASFCLAHGLLIRDLRDDGRIHRCPTIAKPRSDNGAYMLDGNRGWCMDWQAGGTVQWWTDEHAKPWTHEQKVALDMRRRQQALDRTARASLAAATARQMLSEAELVIPTPATAWRPGKQATEAVTAHPYLVGKGFPQEMGLVREGTLLIPMYRADHYRELVGLQRISPDGSKLFLPGMRARGAAHRLGSGMARETWLCEGYVTALTVRLALKQIYRVADVLACFSASNMVHVASLGIGTHVMADHDASRTGEEAAIDTGLPWCMPKIEGQDANDLMVSQGIEAVIQLILDMPAGEC